MAAKNIRMAAGGLFAAAALFVLASGCASSSGTAPAQGNTARNTGPYYEGAGGKGISITVDRFTGDTMTAANERYMPQFIQNKLMDDVRHFSTMTLEDSQNIDKIISALDRSDTGYFKEEDALARGEVLNADYRIEGSVTKLSVTEYSLQVQLRNVKTGEIAASVTPSA